jgi:aspartyl-tRNA(Asn)/glutamyl-tRNA(Gln) amidotransferase subunit C
LDISNDKKLDTGNFLTENNKPQKIWCLRFKNMIMKKIISKDLVEHIAKLAKIPVSEIEKESLAEGFNKTLAVIDELFKVDVKKVEPTHQVTGLENILRDDVVNEKKMLSQEQALSNTENKHNGYFVVDQILPND